MTRALLTSAIAVPIAYFATVLVAAALTPGYSHVSSYASELGIAGSTAAPLFNGGILLTALVTLGASGGFYLAARQVDRGRLWPALAALSLGLFGVGMVFGGLFPMPDPRHGGFGLGMAIQAAPLLLAVALRRAPELRNLRLFLIATTIVMLAFFLVMMGVGGFVTRANVGVFQRVYALTVFSWIGVAGFVLRGALSR